MKEQRKIVKKPPTQNQATTPSDEHIKKTWSDQESEYNIFFYGPI